MNIFYCAGGKFREVAGSPDAGPEAPDAVPARPVCCLLLAVLGLSTGHSASDFSNMC